MSNETPTEKKFWVVTDQDGLVGEPQPLDEAGNKRQCAKLFLSEICKMYPYEEERDRGEYTISLRNEALYVIPESKLKKPLDQCRQADHLSEILDEDDEDDCRRITADYVMRPDSEIDGEAGDHIHTWTELGYTNNTNGGVIWRYWCAHPGCYRCKISDSAAIHAEKGTTIHSERVVTLDEAEQREHNEKYPIPTITG